MKRLAVSTALFAMTILGGCSGSTSRKPPIEIFADMDRQGKPRPQQAAYRPVPGTVAVGQLNEDDAYHTGIENGFYIAKNPLPMTRGTLETGRRRYDIYCAPCHDRTGGGHGIVPQRSGSWLPTNLKDDRVRNMVDGEIFSVATMGRRSMPAHRFQTSAADRWAIVAYVRALHRASAGSIDDVPRELRSELR